MKHYDFVRMVYSISVRLGVLVIAFGLIPISEAATYEGQWTKIILDKINASSLGLKGTVTAMGPDLTPKSYNLPVTISATRLASLAKGFLRGGVYGLVINEAMVAAGWIWDEAMKNWKKVITQGGGTCMDYPVAQSMCLNGVYRTGEGIYCALYDYKVAPPDMYNCVSGLPAGYSKIGSCGGTNYCLPSYPQSSWPDDGYRKALSAPPPEVVQETPATPQDIFDDGVKPNAPRVIPDIITGLPQVIGTPSSELKKPGMPSIYWPEIVLDLVTFIQNLNFTQNIFDIVNQAFTDLSSLTQTQINTLIDSGINIQTLIDAINNTVNNTQLTLEQKNQLELWNNLQNPTNIPSTVVSPEPVPIEIPTDCELIPFVCAWLEWYRGWLTEDPPPIPESAVPIEDLSDFNPWPTSTSGSCPPPYTFSVFGKSVQVSYQPWCDLAVLIAPLLMALGWLFATYIVLRVR